MKLESQAAQAFLGQGPRGLFENLRLLQAGMVTALRPSAMANFLTRPAPLLPRVVLLTSKAEQPAMWRKLSLDFAGLAVFGHAALDDAAGAKVAAMFGVDKASVPAVLVGPRGPLPSTMVDDAALRAGKAGHFEATSSGSASAWRRVPSPAQGGFTYMYLRDHLDATLPPAPIPQLRSPEDFQRHCGADPDVTLCIIAALPADAERAAARYVPSPEDYGWSLRQRGYEAVDDDEEEDEEERAAARKWAQSGERALSTLRRVASRAFIRVDWVRDHDHLASRIAPIARVRSHSACPCRYAGDAHGPGVAARRAPSHRHRLDRCRGTARFCRCLPPADTGATVAQSSQAQLCSHAGHIRTAQCLPVHPGQRGTRRTGGGGAGHAGLAAVA